MDATTADNRLRYQDTPFETIPYIELGKAVENAELCREIQQISDRPGSVDVAWLEDERRGRIIEIDDETLDELKQVDDRGELDQDYSHAVVWSARENRWSEEEIAVHLLREHETDRILASNLKTLLERLHAYYDAEGRRDRLAEDDPLRTILNGLD